MSMQEENRAPQPPMGAEPFIQVILAIILPPLGVFFKSGCAVEFWICLILTFLGYLPGILYAVYVILMT